jgi:FixJ family two-component response regulator
MSRLEAKDAVETAAHDDGKTTALIVDDDADVRESTRCVLRTISLDSRAFASPPKFIKSDLPSGPTCLVLHVRLPGAQRTSFL